MPPKTTIWELDPHTAAKHAILEAYLKAWFPILSRWNKRLLYIDGFAGPGRYSKGEAGSPLIALRVAREHFADLADELVFLFIEKDARRAAHLREEVAALNLPAEYKVMVVEDEFERALTELLDGLQADKAQLAPAFAMIDPFGVSGLPFTLVERLLQNDKCEVLVTIMTGHIERFIAGPEFGKHVPLAVGDPNAAAIIASSRDRVATTRELYMASLKRTARFARYFTMLNDNARPVYDLFFASQHPLGHQKMKEAMWGIDDSGSFAFSDATDQNQQVLFRGADVSPLARRLSERFRGESVEVERVLTFVRDETAYIDKHCRAALKRLEGEKQLTVEDTKTDGSRRKKGTFPPEAVVTFGQSR